MANCFSNYSSLYDFDQCLEDYVHANLHQMHAGMWDCSVDWKQELETYSSWLSPHLLSFLGNELSAAARSSELLDTLISCPSDCDMKTQDFWGM